jgi:6-pyruvoyltetrahydropterin/6-carboxytetrahydropterin synthase
MTKLITPQYTACFRQWKAEGTHCRYTHAYKVWFEIEFNKSYFALKQTHPEIMAVVWNMLSSLDFKTFVATDDPYLDKFMELHRLKVISLMLLPQVGCERFSEFILNKVNTILSEFSTDIKCLSVETFEHNKNSGIAYLPIK